MYYSMIIDTITEDGAYVSDPEEATREDITALAEWFVEELGSMTTLTFISGGLPAVVRGDKIIGVRFTEVRKH